MTVEEVLKMTEPAEIFEAIKHHPETNVQETRDHLAKIRHERFKTDIIECFGSFDPDAHYDFGRIKD